MAKEQTPKSGKNKMQDIMEWHSWKEIDINNKIRKIFHIPKLNKEGRLYVERINKEPEAIIEEEWMEIESKCSTLSKAVGIELMDDNPLSPWVQEAQSILNIPRRSRRSNPLFLLGTRLMASPISSIPGAIKHENHWTIPHKHCTLAWIAFIENYGLYTPDPTPICYKDQFIPIKEWGEKVITQSITKENEDPFNKQNILTQGNNGAHDICLWAMNNKMGSDSSSLPWENTIVKLLTLDNRSEMEERLLSVLIRLGKTPPQLMPGWNNDTGLPFSTVNWAWVAAQMKFGNLWREKKEGNAFNEPNGNTNTFFKPIIQRNVESSQRIVTTHTKETQDNNLTVPMEGIIRFKPPGETNLEEKKDETIIITPDMDTVNNKGMNKWENSLGNGNDDKEMLLEDNRPTIETQTDHPLETNSTKNNKRKKVTFNPYKQENSNASPRLNKEKISTKKYPSKKEMLKRSILKLRLPILVESVQERNNATNQAVEMVKLIWKSLLQTDPNNTMILGWKLNDGKDIARPLKVDSDMPSSKGKLHGKYIDDFKLNWSNSNSPSEMRMVLGHRKPIEEIIEYKHLVKRVEEMECEVLVDRIQSEKRCVTGYLAGPLITESTADELAEALLSLRIYSINGITQLEIVEKEINIFQGNSKKRVKRTKAMHVITANAVKAKARACLAKTFPSKVKGDYPLGIQYRFVPNTADTDFVVSSKARDIAKRLKNKQAGFLDNIIIRENNHIKSIFKSHPSDNNINLQKILTALRSKRYPTRQLFVSIEQEYDEGPVIFQYSSEMENEADGIIPVIPLYIKGVFGNMENYWFKPSADIGIEGYEYLHEERRVIPSKSNVLANLDEDWDQSMMRYEDDSISDYDSEGDDDYGGFSIEFGDLKIHNRDVQANIDESASTGTMNLPQPEGFIDPDLTSEQRSVKNNPNIVVNLSKEFTEQELSPAEELKGLSNINLGGKGKKKPTDKESYKSQNKQNKMEQGSTIGPKEEKYNNMESYSTDEEDSSMAQGKMTKYAKKYTTTTTKDSKNNNKNLQSKVPEQTGKISFKTTNSTVYAPSKQDGGGEAP